MTQIILILHIPDIDSISVSIDFNERSRFRKLVDYASRRFSVIGLIAIFTPTEQTEVSVSLIEQFHPSFYPVVIPSVLQCSRL